MQDRWLKEELIYIEIKNEKRERVSTVKIKNLLKDIEVKGDKCRDIFYRNKTRHYVHKNKRKYNRKTKHKKQESD